MSDLKSRHTPPSVDLDNPEGKLTAQILCDCAMLAHSRRESDCQSWKHV